MKKFSLEEYIKNPSKKVVTRDGRDVRIICTDKKGSGHPIVALVKSKFNNVEEIYSFTKNGSWSILNSSDDESSMNDLFFATVNHEGWINIYNDINNDSYIRGIYSSKKEAIKSRKYGAIATVKVEWEE